MSKCFDNESNITRFFIPIDGKYHETSEEIHQAYFSMDRRERYLQELSNKNELSYEVLNMVGFPVIEKIVDEQKAIEDMAISAVLIEKMLAVLSELSDKDKWIIDNLFVKGKSEVELSKLSGVARTTIQSRKYGALKKIRDLMEAND